MIIPEQVHLLYKDYKVKKTSNLRSDSVEQPPVFAGSVKK